MLAAFIEENDLSAREIANAIPCSEASISRILAGESLPTNNMLVEVGLENEKETGLGNERVGQIVMGNDEFILFIRKNFPDCSMTTNQLGKKIRTWLRDADPKAEIIEKGLPCYWGDKGDFISADRLPKTATQFKFDINVLSDLYEYLCELGSVTTKL